jgi:hypothetical protein
MSQERDKIKYKEEGAYGSTNERTLYCIRDGVSDYTNFYYDDGELIFSFPDTLNDNIFEKMFEMIKNWRNNPNIEKMTLKEYKKCRP